MDYSNPARNMYDALFEQASDGIFLADPTGKYIVVNDQACIMLGYTREALLRLSMSDLLSAEDLARSPMRLKELRAGKIILSERRLRRKDGSSVLVELSAKMLADGTLQEIVRDITERQPIMEQLQSLANFPEENPYPVLRLRHDGLIVYANAGSQWLLTLWNSHIGSYAPADWCETVTGTLDGGASRIKNIQHGADHWSFSVVPVPEKRYVNLYGHDITTHELAARKKLELAAIVESSEDAIIGKTPDGIITSWNTGAEHTYGYSETDMIGRPIATLIPPGFEEDRAQALEKVRSGKHIEHYDTTHQRKDGERIRVSVTISPLLDPAGELVAASVISRDITERHTAQESLRLYAEQLAVINRLDRIIVSGLDIDQLYDRFVTELASLVTLDRTSLLFFNESGDQWQIARQWTSYQPLFSTGDWHLVQGSVLEWIIANPAPFIESEVGERGDWPETALLKQEGIHSRTILPLIIQDQVIGILTVASHLSAAFSKEQHTILVAIADQLALAIQSERLFEQVKSYSTELEQRVAQRTAALEAANKELEAFSYSVSHDLRAPLRAMDGFSSILLDEYGPTLPEKAQHYLNLVRESAQQMGNLIDQLLAFSRLGRQALRKESIAPDSLARSVITQLISHEAGRQIETVIPDLPPCLADPILLRQVFANLLGNALKFTQKREVAKIEVGSLLQADQTIYFVKDNGVGFDMQYANKLFGVFQRLHRAEDFEGTGVGLATVQRIIHRHGGRIWAEATLNEGATFFFTLTGDVANDH